MTLLSKFPSSLVECVFEITHLLSKGGRQYLILLKDGSYICTLPFFLQNKGIVCRHFFAAMLSDQRCRYHISLVRKRWLKEEYQDGQTLDLEREVFHVAFKHAGVKGIRSTPPCGFMEHTLSIYPFTPSCSKPHSGGDI